MPEHFLTLLTAAQPGTDGVPDPVQAIDLARAIIENAFAAFIAINQAGEVVEWSRQAEATFGWKRAEALGRPVADLLVPEELRNAHRLGMDNYLRTGVGPLLGKHVEVTAVTRAGRRIPVILAISAHPWGQGGQLFTAFVRDISEQQEAHAKLMASHDVLSAQLAARGRLEQEIAELRQLLGGQGTPHQEAADAAARLNRIAERLKESVSRPDDAAGP